MYFNGDSYEHGREVYRLSFRDPQAHRHGDFNLDGVTDLDDFLILAAHFGQAVDSTALGDADEDGLVSFKDFVILSANFTSSQDA